MEEIKLCDYGCGQEANYTLKNGKNCCSKSWNSCPINRENISKAHKDGRILGWSHLTKEQRGWSKGLTKETDERVNKIAISFSESIKNNGHCWTGRHHSEETKEKLSIARTKYIHENDHHVNWFNISNGEKEFKVQGTWEYNVALKLNELNIKWDRKFLKYDNHHRYTPDFYLPELDTYLEVKGYLRNRDINKTFRVLQEHDITLLFLWGVDEFNNFIQNGNLLNIPTFFEIFGPLGELAYPIGLDPMPFMRRPSSSLGRTTKIILCKITWIHDKIFIKKIKENNKQQINKISYEETQKLLIPLIENSNIDFSKFGWVNVVAQIINKQPQKVNGWMKRFMLEFYEEKCFKRKSS